jgi:transcriptional regulator with XRE-family HTH domain
MAGWIGRDLERLRKLRGLRRVDVAAQLSLSPSTIRNIEHDESYNVSLDLLRQVATVLGATVSISLDVPEVQEGDQHEGAGTEQASAETASGGQPSGATNLSDAPRVVTNDQFIRLIRERYPECPLTNSQIGRRMWQFAKSRGAELVKGRKQLKRSPAMQSAAYRVPTTAAQYSVKERDVRALERFADRLGRAFKDSQGRVLVPIK